MKQIENGQFADFARRDRTFLGHCKEHIEKYMKMEKNSLSKGIMKKGGEEYKLENTRS